MKLNVHRKHLRPSENFILDEMQLYIEMFIFGEADSTKLYNHHSSNGLTVLKQNDEKKVSNHPHYRMGLNF